MSKAAPQISLFTNKNITKPSNTLTLSEFVDGIKEGAWKSKISTVSKDQLPGVTLSGTFTARKGAAAKHSGYLGIDVDGKDNKRLLTKRKQLEDDQYVHGCWTSVSGKGLRLLFKINSKKHLQSFQAIKQYLLDTHSIIIDSTGKDQARLTFVSHDPKAYIDLTKATFTGVDAKADKKSEVNHVEWLDDIKRVAAEVKKRKVDITGEYKCWFDIGQVVAELGEPGRKYFHIFSQFHPAYTKVETDEQYNKCLERVAVKIAGQPELTIGTLMHYASAHGISINTPVVRARKSLRQTGTLVDIATADARYANRYVWGIWEFVVKQNKKHSWFIACLGIDVEAAASYLFNQGVRCWGEEYYRIQDNVVTPYTLPEIHELLHQKALALPKDTSIHFGTSNALTRDVVLAASHQTLKSVFQKITLKPFNHAAARFVKDTAKEIHLFFSNGVVVVKSGSFKLMPYAKLSGFVWAKWIKPREFKPTTKLSVVQKIMDNAVGKKARDAYMSAIGYMISTHMQPIGSPILLCSDIEITDMQDGGTGKDFMRQILENVRAVTKIDGKVLDFNKEFAFAKVTQETEIVWIEDLRKGMSMANFYGMNEGLTVRRLHTQPFEVKCKIGMSLQHSIEMEGNSDTRRQVFLAYGPHYRQIGGIDKELGYMVLQDDFKEWDAFYMFIVECCKIYLKKGIVRMDVTKLKEIRKEELGGEGFDRLLMNTPYTLEEAYKIWAADGAGFFDKATQMTFKVSWVRWCRLSNINLLATRKDDKRLYTMAKEMPVKIKGRK